MATSLRRGSAVARLLGLRVRIQPGSWTSVCSKYRMLSDGGFYYGLIQRPEESCWVWCVCRWERSGTIVNSTSTMSRWKEVKTKKEGKKERRRERKIKIRVKFVFVKMKGENTQHFCLCNLYFAKCMVWLPVPLFYAPVFIRWAASETIRYMQFDLVSNVTVLLPETNIESFRSFYKASKTYTVHWG